MEPVKNVAMQQLSQHSFPKPVPRPVPGPAPSLTTDKAHFSARISHGVPAGGALSSTDPHKTSVTASIGKTGAEIIGSIGNGLSHKPMGSEKSFFNTKSLSKAVTAYNYGITAYDTAHAIQKFKDPNSSMISKQFSLATVGLDVVTIVAHHAGNGPIAMGGALASIGTSWAADLLQYKKQKP